MNQAFAWPDGRPRAPLPIDEKLPEVLGALSSHFVVIVQGELGSGKTSRLGQAVMFNPWQPWTAGTLPVWHTQPRRNAVRWNGRRICTELGCRPGETVGWMLAGEEPFVSASTQIRLCVVQTLINQIRKASGALPEGLIIVDEAHENTVEQALLLGLIRQGLSQSPKTKVLIASGTIDERRFSRFFGNAPVVKVPGRVHEVLTRVTKLKPGEHHTEGALRAACNVFDRFREAEPLVLGFDNNEPLEVKQGSIIVLLPGKADIRHVALGLQQHAEKHGAKRLLDVLTCHGESSPKAQDAIQLPVPPGVLRFVLGTEVLRASVTVTDTVGVIDSLQVKRFITDPAGVGHFSKIAVSAAEARQGRARAGRTQRGFYIPVSYEDEYDKLEESPIPATRLCPISSLVLQVAAVGHSVQSFPLLDAPDRSRREAALARLVRLGALDSSEKITALGKEVVRLPVDPERGVILHRAAQMQVLPEAIVLMAILENGSILDPPYDLKTEIDADEDLLRFLLAEMGREMLRGGLAKEHALLPVCVNAVDLANLPPWVQPSQGRYRLTLSQAPLANGNGAMWAYRTLLKKWSGDSSSDFTALVFAYRDFKREERLLSKKLQGQAQAGTIREDLLRQWAEDRFINYAHLRKAEHTMQLIWDELRRTANLPRNALTTRRRFSSEALSMALLCGFFDHLGRRVQGRLFEGPLGRFELSRASICPRDEQYVLCGGLRKLNVSRVATELEQRADLACPIKPGWFAQAVPQLFSETRLGDLSYNENRDRVEETVQSRVLNLQLAEEKQPAIDRQAACQVFVHWLLQHEAELDDKLGEILGQNRALLNEVERYSAITGTDEMLLLLHGGNYASWLERTLAGGASRREASTASLRLEARPLLGRLFARCYSDLNGLLERSPADR